MIFSCPLLHHVFYFLIHDTYGSRSLSYCLKEQPIHSSSDPFAKICCPWISDNMMNFFNVRNAVFSLQHPCTQSIIERRIVMHGHHPILPFPTKLSSFFQNPPWLPPKSPR